MAELGVVGGFGGVDASADPDRLAAYLDALANAAPVRAGKRRRDGILAFPGARVLDVGCGAGEDVRAMGRLVGPRGRAVGVDASAALLVQARARVTPGDGPVGYVRADAAALPFPAASFDGARVERTLQHVAEPAAVITELVRVVRPGGRVLAVEPDWETLVLDLEPPAAARAGAAAMAGAVRHPRVGRALRRMLADAGLAGVEVRAEAYVIADPRALGAADPVARMAEVAGGAHGDVLAAAERAAARGRFLAALTVFEAGGVRPG
jgi:SAM-dependent methyltransferase